MASTHPRPVAPVGSKPLNLGEFTIDDELYRKPYVDIDEVRGEPAPHRYLHGGFEGTANRFSFYFPSEATYEGRFFQHITPVPESENLAPGLRGEEDKIGFAFSSGAFFVETNGGGPIDLSRPQFEADPTIGAYRANAAAATFAKHLASQIYGDHRTYGYAYGGSGGGFRTIACAENTRDVWDGFVPHVIGSPVAVPNVMTVRMHAMRVLRNVLDRIVDQTEPGAAEPLGAGLNAEEKAAFDEVTRMGFPPQAWVGHRDIGTQSFGVLYTSMKAIDPGYFEDFWTVPGYLGADPSSSVHRDRVRARCEVREVITRDTAVALGLMSAPVGPSGGVDEAFKGPAQGGDVVVALRLSDAPRTPTNAELQIDTGAAAGRTALLQRVASDVAFVDFPELSPFLQQLVPGDTVTVDNSNMLAAQTYHRHQVPGREFQVWDQFRAPSGEPLFPQRDVLLGPLFAQAASGSLQSGDISGKMIVVEALYDREAYAWQAVWYAGKVREHLGDRADEHLRVWMVDRAVHADVSLQAVPTHTVSYLGAVQTALRQVAAWAESGAEPDATSAYDVVDGQMHRRDNVAPGGVQPLARLLVGGAERAEITVGDRVTLRATGYAVGETSRIVAVHWDLHGTGTFEIGGSVEPARTVDTRYEHSFAEAGTYFVSVKVVAQQFGDGTTPYARVENIARVRVVVR